MKPLAALATTTALVLGLVASARAGNTRVVVAGPEADAIASRLQKELTSMGFEPVRVDEAAACSRGAIAAWIDEMHAAGAACSDGATVAIWISGKNGLRLADSVAPREGDGPSPDLVAVRAAEVTRASLELSAGEAVPAVTPPRQPPSWTAAPASPTLDAERDRRRPARLPFPRTPALAVGTGIGAAMSADSTVPVLDLEFEIRVARYLAIATRGDIPLQSTTISTSRSTIKIAPVVFGLGLVVPFASPDSFVVPRLGAGTGFVWLRSEAFASSFNTLSSGFSGTMSNRDDIFSPLLYGNAAASLRVSTAFRLVFDGLLGATAHRMVVRDGGTNVAYWGQPFGTIAMRGELVFR